MLGQEMLPRVRACLPGRFWESRWAIPGALLAAGILIFAIETVSTSLNPRMHWVIDLLVATAVVPLVFGHLLSHLVQVIRDVRLEKAAEVLEAQRAISRELHDSVAQRLCFLHLRLDQVALEPQLASLGHIKTQLEELRQATNEAYEELYGLMSALRPAHVGDLSETLRARAEQAKRRSGLQVDVVAEGVPFDLAPASRVEVVRIVGEALSNVEKHAGGDKATIYLQWGRDDLEVCVSDNGRGFAPESAAAGGHFGLKIMHERADRVAGGLRVSSSPGAGTSIRLTVPRVAAIVARGRAQPVIVTQLSGDKNA